MRRILIQGYLLYEPRSSVYLGITEFRPLRSPRSSSLAGPASLRRLARLMIPAISRRLVRLQRVIELVRLLVKRTRSLMRGGVEAMKKTDGKLFEAIMKKSMCIPGSGSTVYPRPRDFGDFRHHFISEKAMAVSLSLRDVFDKEGEAGKGRGKSGQTMADCPKDTVSSLGTFMSCSAQTILTACHDRQRKHHEEREKQICFFSSNPPRAPLSSGSIDYYRSVF